MNAIIYRNLPTALECAKLIKPNKLYKVDKDGNTPLMLALKSNNKQVSNILIKKSTPEIVNTANKHGERPLDAVISTGDLELFNNLLLKVHKKAFNEYDKDGNSILNKAARGKSEIFDNALKLVNPEMLNLANNKGYTPFHEAVKTGNKEICKTLVNLLGSKAFDNNNKALVYAIQSKDVELCEFLINSIDDKLINIIDSDGTPLMRAIEAGLNKVAALLSAKMSHASINAQDCYMETALFKAIRMGNFELCELLLPLTNYTMFNSINCEGDTILSLAILYGHDNIAGLVMKYMGSHSISSKNYAGETALTLAAEQGFVDLCKALATQMTLTGLNEVNNNYDTALTIAAKKNHTVLCGFLLSILNPATVDLPNSQNNTALTFALQNGNIELAKLLIDKMNYKAVTLANNEGNTALMIAAEFGLEEICRILLLLDPESVGAVNMYGCTALMKAESNDHTAIYQLLLKAANDSSVESISDDFIERNNTASAPIDVSNKINTTVKETEINNVKIIQLRTYYQEFMKHETTVLMLGTMLNVHSHKLVYDLNQPNNIKLSCNEESKDNTDLDFTWKITKNSEDTLTESVTYQGNVPSGLDE